MRSASSSSQKDDRLARTRAAGQDEGMIRRKDADVAIRCTDLSIARASRTVGTARVVDGVTFSLPVARTLTVMGPTGSGKSSLAVVLAGAADDGLAVVGGDAVVE